jgi:hypothetical protein
MEERLRRLPVPMIPRVVNGELLLDVRTMDRNDFRRMAEEWNAYGICRKEEVADL